MGMELFGMSLTLGNVITKKSGKRSILWLRIGCQRLQEEFQVMRYKLASQIGYQKCSLATNRTFMAVKYIHAYLWSVNLKFPFFFSWLIFRWKKILMYFFFQFCECQTDYITLVHLYAFCKSIPCKSFEIFWNMGDIKVDLCFYHFCQGKKCWASKLYLQESASLSVS